MQMIYAKISWKSDSYLWDFTTSTLDFSNERIQRTNEPTNKHAESQDLLGGGKGAITSKIKRAIKLQQDLHNCCSTH